MRNPVDSMSWEAYPKGNITQFFSENPELYKDPPMLLKGHNGIDIVKPWGTPIYAVCDQRVVETKTTSGGYGKHVRCLTDEYEILYGHLSSISVRVGERLKEGDLIGKMGNTGFVISGATPFWKYNPYAGTHVHLQFRKVKPYTGGQWYVTYITGERWEVLDYTLGYRGAIDPLPLFQIPEILIQEEEIKRTMMLTIISLLNRIISILKVKTR